MRQELYRMRLRILGGRNLRFTLWYVRFTLRYVRFTLWDVRTTVWDIDICTREKDVGEA